MEAFATGLFIVVGLGALYLLFAFLKALGEGFKH